MNTYRYFIEQNPGTITMHHAREQSLASGIIVATAILGHIAVQTPRPKVKSNIILPSAFEIEMINQTRPEDARIKAEIATIDTPPSNSLEEFVERCKGVWGELIRQHGAVYQPTCNIYEIHSVNEEEELRFARYAADPDEADAIRAIHKAIPIYHDPSDPPTGMYV